MDRFRKEMLVVEVLDAHPDAAGVFRRLGYRCVDADDWCVVIEKDSLAQAAEMHGKPLDELLAALNGLPPAPPPDGAAPAAAKEPAP
jgi:hypothetical protein